MSLGDSSNYIGIHHGSNDTFDVILLFNEESIAICCLGASLSGYTWLLVNGDGLT